MVIGTDCYVVFVVCHHTYGCFQDTILTGKVVKVEMTIGRASRYNRSNAVIHIGIMLCCVGTQTKIGTGCLFLPVDIKVVAPSVVMRIHFKHGAEGGIFIQILFDPVSGQGECFALAKVDLNTCTHWVALSIVLHG